MCTHLFLVHLIEVVDDGLEIRNCTKYQSHTNMHIHTHTHAYTLNTGVYDISKGRGIAEGGGGLGVPFSLAIPRNQRVGPNGEKPGISYHKHCFSKILFLLQLMALTRSFYPDKLWTVMCTYMLTFTVLCYT